MLPAPVTGANRRSANLVISIPHTREASVYRPHFKPSGKLLFRYLPWLVGFTIVLWLFVLRGDGGPPTSRTGPLRGNHPHMPQPGRQGLPYSTRPAPMRGAPPPPPDPEKKVVKWNWPVVGKITGKKKDEAKEDLKPVTQTLWDRRAEKVKDAFVHAFEGYTRHAAGYDELLPIVGGSVNNFNGWGVTVFDSLDTMWIMGLRDMFKDSLALVAKADFDTKPGKYAPFFETIIRYLGGLLSAYALSGEPLLLTRADDLGRALLPGFESPSGLPMFAVNTKNGDTKKGWSGDVLWSEALSNQMEFKYLAHITGRKEYFTKTDEIMQKMYNATLPNGLFPSKWHYETGTPANEHYSVGAYADSAYEYMLKQWLLSGRSEPQALELYMNSANAILEKMIYITPTRHLLYVTDLNADTPTHTLEHLSCFLPGLLALGVHTLTDDLIPKKTRERHLWAAEGLAETCWITYADTETGLGPDEMRMKPWPPKTESTTTTEKRDGLWGFGAREDEDVGGKWMAHVRKWERGGRVGGKPPGARTVPKESDPGKRDWSPTKTAYLLRPETIESFYILWKVTGDAKWRDRGWAVFESIDRHARTKYGYASVSNVDVVPPQWKDEMPSYFLAETLKYLYLLFVEEDLIPFEYWVFNTEAHPLPIFNWTSWETEAYGIHTDLSTAS